ncbi:Wzz/FepE/Etk N-terminal domain-containing protein [Sulfurihydrogenibium sp.]|uniref:GumC family protein n=1 Tax=Sulfurihydrogenibium sp. TaxID=2053621 RepID=UPI00260C550A|nr:Wzz/FepE/Etk N-terminal domain-containing protein [Sulfurihydrogenibium sp.]
MEEKNVNTTSQQQCYEDEIDLFQLWETIWNNRKFIMIFTGVITFLTGVISFILPKTYTSEAVIVPISKSSGGSGLSAIAAMAGLPVGTDQNQSNVKAVLESLTLRERVIKDLNLIDEILEDSKEEYKYPLQVAAEKIKKNINANVNQKEGTIKITVDWKNPEMAQKINQSVIDNLRKILNEKAFTVAKMNRVFYENELEKTKQQLKDAMEQLNKFQKEKQVIMPENQLQNQLQLYANLIAEKLQLEAKINSMSTVLTADHPQLKEAYNRLAYLNQKIAEVEGKIKTDSPLSTEKTLSVIPDYAPIYMKVQQLKAKYEILGKLLEQARIDELKENLYVEVIDYPTYPEKPSKPKKRLMVAVAFVSSLFLAIFIVFIREAIKNRKKRFANL